VKKYFYIGLAGLALFEISKVYFIMPMPGSQQIESLGLAYFLNGNRWIFRGVFLLTVAAGAGGAFRSGKRWPAVTVAAMALAIVWAFNFPMMADTMFKQPRDPTYKARAENKVDEDSVVLGLEVGGQAKAYPIRFLVYHHQVRDTVGGQPVIVTYCSVCRTGRVFEPVVAGRPEKFRLVGMDHFNAMFEDATTGSWWRQESGEAVAGPLTGARLPQLAFTQSTLKKWFEMHPGALVLQPDDASTANYDPEGKYERGKSRGELTRTDSASWNDKSWVVGIEVGSISKAYDWNRLKRERVINDRVGETPVVLVLAADQASFSAFRRPAAAEFSLAGDGLAGGGRTFDLAGQDLADSSRRLEKIQAYQEFWHSWRTFHPGSLRDQ